MLKNKQDPSVDFFSSGYNWYAQGDMDKAIEDYDKAIGLNPKDGNYFFNRGLAWQAKGKLDKAIEDYDKAISLNPKDGIYFSKRGSAWKARREIAKAIDDYYKAINLNPQKVSYFCNRGIAWKAKGELNRAIEDYSEAIRLNPQAGDYFSNRGLAWQTKGELDKAIEDYDKAIGLNPQKGDYFYNRGNAWEAKRELAKAIEDYDKAIDLNPQSGNYFSNRGLAWQAKGELAKAIEDYDKAIGLNPQSGNYFSNRGLAKQAKGELDEAIEDYDKAINLNPQKGDYFYNRGNAWEAKGELAKAIEDYNKAIRLNPKDADYFNNRGTAWQAKGELDEAITDYNEAIRLNSRKKIYHNNYEIAMQAKAKLDKAIVDFPLTDELDSEIYNSAFFIYFKSKLKIAITDYKNSLQSEPANVAAHIELSLAYLKLEKIQQRLNVLKPTEPLEQPKTWALLCQAIWARYEANDLVQASYYWQQIEALILAKKATNSQCQSYYYFYALLLEQLDVKATVWPYYQRVLTLGEHQPASAALARLMEGNNNNNPSDSVLEVNREGPLPLENTLANLSLSASPRQVLTDRLEINRKDMSKLKYQNDEGQLCSKILGEGGFATVYQGLYENTIPVAIKEIKIKLLTKIQEKLLQREIAIMARLSSPYIVTLYGVCMQDYHPDERPRSLIMEFVELGSLKSILIDKNESKTDWLYPLAWEPQRQQILCDISQGLAYLHSNEILHRDLKSENILITRDFHAKIADFGISKDKMTGTEITLVNMGSRGYKAPELIINPHAPTSFKTDMYSYGVILYEIASRRVPACPAATAQGLKPPLPADCPANLNRLVQASMNSDPNKRPTAQQAAASMTSLGFFKNTPLVIEQVDQPKPAVPEKPKGFLQRFLPW